MDGDGDGFVGRMDAEEKDGVMLADWWRDLRRLCGWMDGWRESLISLVFCIMGIKLEQLKREREREIH